MANDEKVSTIEVEKSVWTKGRMEGHAYTVWVFLGIVFTVSMFRGPLGDATASYLSVWRVFVELFFRELLGTSVAVGLGVLVAAAVTALVSVEVYKNLSRRYGRKD